MMDIGEKLKLARADANLTQEILAEKLSVSRQTISNWENGRSYPDIASLISLSDIYNVTLDSLLKGDEKIIKHLKQSTDIVKSNKQVIHSLLSIGVSMTILIVIAIIFRPLPFAFVVGFIIANVSAVVLVYNRKSSFCKPSRWVDGIVLILTVVSFIFSLTISGRIAMYVSEFNVSVVEITGGLVINLALFFVPGFLFIVSLILAARLIRRNNKDCI